MDADDSNINGILLRSANKSMPKDVPPERYSILKSSAIHIIFDPLYF
jgi:hypothetical protein